MKTRFANSTHKKNTAMKRFLLLSIPLLIALLSACFTAPTPTTPPAEPNDTTPPTVLSVDPPNGATGVVFTSNIIITFSEKMDQIATQNAYQSATLPADQVTFSWNAEGTVLTVDPQGDLLYARGSDVNALAPRSYDFNLGATAKDSSGNALASVSSSFSSLRRIQTRLPAIRELCGTAFSNGFSAFGVNTVMPRVGDSNGSGNVSVAARAFFTFDLSSIPNTVQATDLDFAELNIYKFFTSGNPYAFGPINVDHVNYGATTDNSSGSIFNTSSLAILGFFDASKPPGYQAQDAKSAVGDDLTNRASRGNRSQYRLAFPGASNNNDRTQDFFHFIVKFTDLDRDAHLLVSYLTP